MGTTGSGREQGLNDLERPLEALRPASIPDGWRDRMLFEAGKASAEPRHRGRGAVIAILATTTIALGGLLAREHMQRRDLEALFAGRGAEPAASAGVVPVPAPLAVVAAAPSSYRALSLQIFAGGLDEPGRPSGLPHGDPAPPSATLRARDARDFLDF